MRSKARTSKKKGSTKKRAIARNPEASLDELIVAAEEAQASLDNEKALDLLSNAAGLLRMGRTSTSDTRERLLIRVLEKLGEAKVGLGDQSGAKADFEEALQLLEQEPEKNLGFHETRSSLFFYLGQLCLEHEALQAYHQGIMSLEQCFKLMQHQNPDQMIQDDRGEDLLHEMRAKLSGGYCTVAELYLTDLCFEDTAETQCEQHLEKALQLKDHDDQPFPDALQTMASLRLSQKQRQQEGTQYILRAFQKMKDGCDALASLVGLLEQGPKDEEEVAMELKNVDAANNLPEYEFRCQTAKLLLECAGISRDMNDLTNDQIASEQECVAAAISVLGSLLAQNDEVIEIWFLTGCAFSLKRPPMVDSATFYLERAMEMLKEVRKVLQKEAEFVDEVDMGGVEEELEENQVQIDDVQAKLDELQESIEQMED